MATSQEIQCTNIINNVEAMNMVSFAMNDVPKIMANLGVPRMSYFIGGSIAAMLHGINLSRTPHDIDIIDQHLCDLTQRVIATRYHDTRRIGEQHLPLTSLPLTQLGNDKRLGIFFYRMVTLR